MRIVITLTLVLSAAWAAAGAEPASRVTELALFKNGFGFVTAAVDVPAGATSIELDNIPDASLGTLWFEPLADGARVTGIRRVTREIDQPRAAADFAAVLKANLGKKVHVVAGDREYVGIVQDMTSPAPEEPPKTATAPGTEPVVPAAPALCALKTDQNALVWFRAENLDAVELLEPGEALVSEKKKESRLLCTLDRPAQGGTVLFRYLHPDLSWLPAYRVDLLEGDQAKVELRGALLNDAADLDGTQVSFIAGFPNLMFSNVKDTVTAQQTALELMQAIAAAMPGNMANAPWRAANRANALSNQIMSNASMVVNWAGDLDNTGAAPDLSGAFQEDLFFYTPVPATVAKGERASFMLAECTGPCEHVYRWEIPETALDRSSGRDDASSLSTPEPEPVWHTVRLKNASASPWTTGPVLVTRNGLPISQDVIHYTPVNGEARIPLTRAIGIAAEKVEEEINREDETQRTFYGYHNRTFSLVTVRGTLRVSNNRDEEITIEIEKDFAGKITGSSPEGKVTVRAEGLSQVNSRGDIQWRLTIPAGETREVTYTLQVYV